MEKKEVKLVIDKEFRNKLVQYLGTKPYNEVFNFIPTLMQAESVDSYNLKNKLTDSPEESEQQGE